MINPCKKIVLLFALLLIFPAIMFAASKNINLKKIKVLVYTKNGKGFVHDNISSAVKCIEQLGIDNGFKVDISDNPSVFTSENLKQYTMLIFASTNNDVFDTDEQRLAFRHYTEAGGGFVGIHSVTGTERNWTWFKQMIGCTFAIHDFYQKFDVKVIAPNSPLVKGIPKVWHWADECYFGKEWYPGITVVMADDLTTLDAAHPQVREKAVGTFSNLYPAVWYQNFDGGNIWITALGHAKEDYTDPVFVTLILNGIKFIAAESKKLDYSKAYADSRDMPVRY